MKENSIEEDIILLKDFTEGNFKRDKLENYKGSYKMGYFYYKDIQQAIERVLSDYTRLLKENTDLKELYIRTAKHQEKIGHTELAGYMLAQIEAVPTFTTWEEYTTWVDKDKIREFIKNELPDDEIMKCCSNYDVDGVRLRKELQKLLEEK